MFLIWKYIIQALLQLYRYEESEKEYKKFLEIKPRNSAAEKELSQLLQAQSALDTASTLFESGEFAKALEYVDKVVLVFSPACSKVHPFFLQFVSGVRLSYIEYLAGLLTLCAMFVVGKASQSEAVVSN